jgi:hypothetical protein
MRILRVSELFYSIQGEGARAGEPSIFVRLAVMKQRAEMVTCALSGVFLEPEVRAEFMAHCK